MNFFDFLVSLNSSGFLLYLAIFSSVAFIILVICFLASKLGFKFKFFTKFFTLTNENEELNKKTVSDIQNTKTEKAKNNNSSPIVNNFYHNFPIQNDPNHGINYINTKELAIQIKNFLIEDPLIKEILTSKTSCVSNNVQLLNMVEKLFEESYHKQLEFKIAEISAENDRLKKVIRDLNVKLAKFNSLNHDLILSYENSRAFLYKRFMLFFKSIIINRPPSNIELSNMNKYIEENMLNSLYDFYKNLNANNNHKFNVIWKDKEIFLKIYKQRFKNELENEFTTVFNKLREINIDADNRFEIETNNLDAKLLLESQNISSSIHKNIFKNQKHKFDTYFIKHIANNKDAFYQIVWNNELFLKIVNSACVDMVHIFESIKRDSIEHQLSIIEQIFNAVYRRTELLIKEYVISTIETENINN